MASVLEIKNLPQISPNTDDIVPVSHGGTMMGAKVADVRDKLLRSEVESARKGESTLLEKINGIDSSLVDLIASLSDRYTKEEVTQKINDLINAAPQTLDTLKEIADALGNDPNFSTTIINLLGNKVDKDGTKVLTDNNYSNDDKSDLNSLKTEVETARNGKATLDDRLDENDVLVASNTASLSDKVNKTSIVNNLTATLDGFVLDARQGKALSDLINLINAHLSYNTGGTWVKSENSQVNFTNIAGSSYADLFFNKATISGVEMFKNASDFYIKTHINTLRITADTEVVLTNNASSGFIPISASAFNVGSLEEYKTNIVECDSKLDLLKSSKIYEYDLKEDLKNGTEQKRCGFVIGRETPQEVISSGKTIDIYSVLGTLWKQNQELLERIEKLEGKVI